MPYILVNYNFSPTWVKDYTDDYLIYDRSDSKEYLKDFNQNKIIYTSNVGNADYDKLSYLVDNYYDLPEVFVWSKSNLFKFIYPDEFNRVKDNKDFTPLLKRDHRTYADSFGQVCYYDDNWMYNERNDNWYLHSHPAKYFRNYKEFANEFGLPNPQFIPFAPGGSYILTKERVHRYSRDYYDKMRQILPWCQLPGEAHMTERSYYSIWS